MSDEDCGWPILYPGKVRGPDGDANAMRCGLRRMGFRLSDIHSLFVHMPLTTGQAGMRAGGASAMYYLRSWSQHGS